MRAPAKKTALKKTSERKKTQKLRLFYVCPDLDGVEGPFESLQACANHFDKNVGVRDGELLTIFSGFCTIELTSEPRVKYKEV